METGGGCKSDFHRKPIPYLPFRIFATKKPSKRSEGRMRSVLETSGWNVVPPKDAMPVRDSGTSKTHGSRLAALRPFKKSVTTPSFSSGASVHVE